MPFQRTSPSRSGALRKRRLRHEPLERREVLSVGLLTAQFAGIPQTNLRPPDPIASAGPDNVLAMVNSQIALYTKSGAVLERTGLDTFLGSNSGFFEEVDDNFGSFDPWTVFDPYSQRYVAMAEEVEFGTVNSDGTGGPRRGGYGADEANLLIAMSTSSTPNDLDSAPGDSDDDWTMVSIPATYDFGSGLAWIDYPKIAADADSLYITGNYFKFGSRTFAGVLITRLDKASVMSGNAGTPVQIRPFVSGTTLQPAQSFGLSASEPQRFITATLTGLEVLELDDNNNMLIGATSAPYADFGGGAPQLGGSDRLDTISPRLMNAVWRDGSLWTTHTVSVGGEATVRWYELREGLFNQYTIMQSGNVDPGPGLHTFMPSIAVDGQGNMGLTFTQSSSTQFAAMMYTGRRLNDPAGYTAPPRVVRAGDSYYAPDPAAGVERWGDYSGLAIDPADDATFWAYGEFPAAVNQWGTWWGAFQVPAAAIVATPATGLVTNEGSGSAMFNVRLSAAPLVNVTVNLIVGDPSEGAISGSSSLVFTPTNWDVPQTVTIIGQDDALSDGDVLYAVVLTTSTTDPNYLIASPAVVMLTNEDNEADAAPTVMGVEIDSSLGTHAQYALPVGNGEQLRSVPVGRADRITLTFSETVELDSDDLSIEGINVALYTVASFSYDEPSRRATWTLVAPMLADALTLVLDEQVIDMGGQALDGEWDNPTDLLDTSSSAFPTGNGLAGGEFRFRVTVLAGDGNRDNSVAGADYTIWADNFGATPGTAVFIQGDYNGDGFVTGADYTLWADTFGSSFDPGLASPQPNSPAPGAPPDDRVGLALGARAATVRRNLTVISTPDESAARVQAVDMILASGRNWRTRLPAVATLLGPPR